MSRKMCVILSGPERFERFGAVQGMIAFCNQNCLYREDVEIAISCTAMRADVYLYVSHSVEWKKIMFTTLGIPSLELTHCSGGDLTTKVKLINTEQERGLPRRLFGVFTQN